MRRRATGVVAVRAVTAVEHGLAAGPALGATCPRTDRVDVANA